MTSFQWIVLCALGMALLFGWTGLTNSLAFIGAPKRRSRDVTERKRPLPALGQKIVDDLSKLGFRRLGEAETALPLYPAMTEWILVDGDETTTAELMVRPTGPMIQFSTVFGDKSVVESGQPVAENIEDPDFRARMVPGTLQDCYQAHRQAGSDWSNKHGEPRRISTMDEWLTEDANYRQRFAQRKLWRLACSGIAWQSLAVYVVLVVFVAAVFHPWLGFMPQGELERGFLVVVLVVIGLAVSTVGERIGASHRPQPVP